MPKYDTSTPRVERKFSGVDFSVPFVFTEGHALTKPEAAWVNSNLASVVGNAFSGDIRRGLKTLNDAHRKNLKGADLKAYKEITDPKALGWDMQKEFDTKFAEYEMGESNRGSGGGAASDPLSQLVRMFSTVDIKRRLVAKGFKVAPLYKTLSAIGVDGTVYANAEAMKAAGVEPKYPSKWEELVSENILAKGEQFRAQAQAQLDAINGTDETTSDDDALLAGIDQPTATAEETPPAAE